jgi:hypothetical protein
MAANESRLPVPVHQQEHGNSLVGTSKATSVATTEGFVESIQGSLYGEEDEEWIESLKTKTTTRDTFLSRDELLELPWHVRWRIWLLEHSEVGIPPEQTRQLQDDADTRILQRILADLQVDLVLVPENDYGSDDDGDDTIPSRPSLAQKKNWDQAGEDDLMHLVSSGGAEDSGGWKKDAMIAAWKSHERYFVLQDLEEKNIWRWLTTAQQGLIREIVRGIDGLTGSRGIRTPDWMMSEDNKNMNIRTAQPANPTLVLKSYLHEQSQRQATKPSRPATTDQVEMSGLEGCEAFSTWVRNYLPADSSLTSLCDQLGREGSRGPLARRLLTADQTQRQLPSNVAMDLRNSWHLNGDNSQERSDSSRGRALLFAFLDDAGDYGSQKSSSVLFSWTGYSGVPSIQEAMDQYLANGPLLPDLWALTQWLWKGAVLISSSGLNDKGMADIWQEIVLAVKRYGDWLPVTAIVVGYREFLRRVISFDDTRAANLILPQTQALTELVTMWIGDRHEWMPILWKQLFGDMQQTIMGVYYSMDCLCSDFDTVHTSMDVSRILTACTTLLAALQGIVGDASCAAKLVVALPSMAGVVGLFSALQLPLQHALPEPIEQACNAIRRSFRQLGASFSANSLPLRNYLRSLVRYAADSTFAAAPSWCQHAATISRRYWKDDNIVAVWVENLLEHLTRCSNSTSTLNPIHQSLHESMVHLCLGSTGCTSLAPLLLESLTKFPLAAVEHVICMSPPTRLFDGDIVNLSRTLKLVLDAFDGPSAAWLLLGMALCLDALSLETRPIADYHAQRDSCLEIARKYLLDKVRRGRPSWLLSLRDQIEAELSNRQATVGVEWWKEVCLDILDKQDASSCEVSCISSMVSAIEPVDSSSLAPSRKRPASSQTTEKAPTAQPDSMEQVSQQPASAADRTEAASRRLEQVLSRGTAVEMNSSSTTRAPAILSNRLNEPGVHATDKCDNDLAANDDDDDDVQPMVDTEQPPPPFTPDDEDDYDEDDDCILLLDLQ